jgi:GntR family transcriptional regulator
MLPAMTVEATRAVAYAARKLREYIARSAWPVGARMPGERALADEIGVSRSTLRSALTLLQDEGIVDGQPQRGWFVRGANRFSDRSSELESFTEIARGRGFEPRSTPLAVERRTASVDEAAALGVPPGAGVIRLRRLRALDGIPLCIDDSLLVAALAERVLEMDLERGSLYSALQELCGITVFMSSCVLQARKAGAEEAGLLDMPAGDPVLELAATTCGKDGTAVLTSTVVYRGDSYRFHAELFRSQPFGVPGYRAAEIPFPRGGWGDVPEDRTP